MTLSKIHTIILSNRINYVLLAISIPFFGLALLFIFDPKVFYPLSQAFDKHYWIIVVILLITVLQLTSGIVVLRTLPLVPYRIPIILIALAMFFSILPNMVELKNTIFFDDVPTFGEEIIELLNGTIIVLGFVLLRPIFYSIKVSTEKIKAGEKKYRAIFETIADPVLLVDAATKRIVDVNQAAMTMYGHTQTELLAMQVTDLSVEPEQTEKAFTPGKKESEIHRHKRKDGSTFSAKIHSNSLVVENRHLFWGVVYDVTEQLKQEEEMLYHSYVLKSINDAVVVTDLDLNVTHWNNIAEELYGILSNEILAKPFSAFVKTNIDDAEKLKINYALMKGQRWKGEYTQTLLDGRTIWVLATSSLLRGSNRKPLGFVTVYKDITENKTAELKLRESEEMLKASQSMAGLGSFVWDLSTGTWQSSEVLDAIFGIDASYDRTLNGWAQIVHPDWRQYMVEYVNSDVLTNRKLFNKQYKIQRKESGIERWVHGLAHLEYDQNDKPTKLIGTIQDITQQKQIEEVLRESERRFRAVLENIALIGVILDIDGNITFCNDFLLSISGWKKGEVLRKNWFEVFIPEDIRMNVRQVFNNAIKKREIKLYHENAITTKTGALLTISWSNIILEDEQGNVVGITSLGEDITERKKAEEALRESERKLKELAEELEAKVRQRTSQLEDSNQQLESFSYSVSHDLRAPIRAIDSFSRIILDEEEKSLSSDGKKNLGAIRNNTQRMGRMIDDLLHFSRTGRAELKKVFFNMEPVASKLLEENLKLEHHRNFKTEISFLPEAYGDPSLLGQVWINLIGNAIKFTRNQETAEISIGGCEDEHESTFWIKDNGSGLDMTYAHKLFGVFQRLHTQQEYEGSGVGLAIVHRIIQRHGGKIWVESEMNKGTKFSFYLPKQEFTKDLNGH